ncbi:RhuM family protein [Salinivibrio sp. MA607]|uniref:RhuM family protein n=1 Tax=Salinivibrio sp. MA607 TaxID=1909457 RepID=UPI003FD35A9E
MNDAEGKLDENAVVRFYRTTASGGKSDNIQHLGLSLVIAVSYRVRSSRGAEFRQWERKLSKHTSLKGL